MLGLWGDCEPSISDLELSSTSYMGVEAASNWGGFCISLKLCIDSASARARCFCRRRQNQSPPRTMAMTATPATTPPTMAPVWLLFLDSTDEPDPSDELELPDELDEFVGVKAVLR